MSDRVHVKRNHNGSVSKRMRYNYDDFRVDIYSYDKSQEQIYVSSKLPSSSVTNGVLSSASSYTVYQSEDITKPMTISFEYHPQTAGTYKLELLFTNTHTTSRNYNLKVDKSLSKSNYQKLALSFSNYCSEKHLTPEYITIDGSNYDFRACLYGFCCALNENLPENITFTNNTFKYPVPYQKDLNINSVVDRTDIITQAISLKKYIDFHNTAPEVVKVGDVTVSISQFAYLMSRAINSTSSTFPVAKALNGTCYMYEHSHFSVTVDGKPVKSKISRGYDIVHSRSSAYINISQAQVDKYSDISKKGLIVTYTFTSANTAFLASSIKKYKLYQADKYNKDGHELTIKTMEISLTNELSTDSAVISMMYNHELDDSTKLNMSGFVFDYRDEINIFIKNNAGVMEHVFGGYISSVELDNDLATLSLSCASRLIDLEHRISLSEIYMNSITDVSEYQERFDYVKNCSNWSSPLEFLCAYAELPLNTNVSNEKPLVMNKTLKEIKYGSGNNRTSKLTTSNIYTEINPSYVMLRNSEKPNITQTVRIFDDVAMGLEDEIVINNFPNIWIDYGLGAVEKSTEGG